MAPRVPVTAALLVAATATAGPALAGESSGAAESESYALPLGLSYLALPALAGGAAALLPDLDESTGGLVVAGVIVLGLAAPVTVHLAHSEPVRAVVSPLGAAGSVVVLGLLGLGVGEMIADAQCGSQNGESSSSCRLSSVLPAAYVGAGIGYVGWAVYDMVADSSIEPRNGLKVGVAPAVSSHSAGVSVFGSF